VHAVARLPAASRTQIEGVTTPRRLPSRLCFIRPVCRFLLAASFLAIGALGGCAHRHTVLRSVAPAPRGFTVAEVRQAFAAEGLPLKLNSREGGTVFLSRSSFDLPVGDVGVIVHPPHMSPGALLVVVVQSESVVRMRNVIVDYDPRSSSAKKARAALARLRRQP
jgi:hypothetical protein